jgi:hypothetical protein
VSDKQDSNSPEPIRREESGPAQPAGRSGSRVSPVEGTPAPPAGSPGTPSTPPRPKRTSAQIRDDMDRQRDELGQSVDNLRERITEITDWRSQIKKHRRPIVVGAVATGFVVGGLMALRRR